MASTSSFSVVRALAVVGSLVPLVVLPVLAQSSVVTVDPAAVCPYQLTDQIQQCRATVYADEAALPGGPCTSTDWACICNVQQGLVACYYPCAGSTPATDVDYNNANCNGQNNGVVNAAASSGGADYSGSPLTTTVPASLSSVLTASITPDATSITAASSSAATTTGSVQSTSAASSGASTSSGQSATSRQNAGSSSAAAPSSSSNVFGGSAVGGAGVSYLAAMVAGLVGVGAFMVAAV